MASVLKRKLSSDNVKHSLMNRPTVDELQRKGIIQNAIQSDAVPRGNRRSRIAIALKGASRLGR